MWWSKHGLSFFLLLLLLLMLWTYVEFGMFNWTIGWKSFLLCPPLFLFGDFVFMYISLSQVRIREIVALIWFTLDLGITRLESFFLFSDLKINRIVNMVLDRERVLLPRVVLGHWQTCFIETLIVLINCSSYNLG